MSSSPASPYIRYAAVLFTAALALLLAAAALPSAASAKVPTHPRSCGYAHAKPSALNRAQIQHATLCLVNRERTRRGRRALKRNLTLEHVAERFTKRMARDGFFDHVAPNGSTLTDRIRSTSYLHRGLRRWALGENIAWGTGSLATPASIVRGWMRSPGHRRNILDRRFREAGFGVIAAVPDRHVTGRAATYTNVFGQRVRG